MGKYKYLNSQEIVNRIEVYGSEEEREVLGAFIRHSFEADCEFCDDMEISNNDLDAKVRSFERRMDLLEQILDNDLSDTGKLADIRERVL